MKVREHSQTRLVLCEKGFTTRHWGLLVVLLAGSGAIVLYLDGDPIPVPVLVMLMVALVIGPIMAIFTGKRLTHTLDKATGLGRVDYPKLLSSCYQTTTFHLSEVRAVRPAVLSAWVAATTRQSERGVSYRPQGGFNYILSDGTEIEAGEFTSVSKEAQAQIKAVSEFLNVPVELEAADSED